MGLASIVLHKLCIDKGVFTPTKLDLTSDHMTDVEVKVNSYTWSPLVYSCHSVN